jgi:uncharacterized protein
LAAPQFDREQDEGYWATRWARAYVEFAAGEKPHWLVGHGLRFLPTVGWAERGDLRADGHGNSVPRFHITRGTGVVEPFARYALQAAAEGLLTFRHRHRVDEIIVTDWAASGVRGRVLADDASPRGVASNRDEVVDFKLTAQCVILATGGIGTNHDLVRKHWPERLGEAPSTMVTGVPAYVDGRMLEIGQRAGAIPGLYAAGEVAGFGGGGGVHGYNALEGTFLGNCLFSGRAAGRAAAHATAG